MKVDISYNDELNGIELHFLEKPSPSIISEVKTKMGFRYSKAKNLWWAKKTKQRVDFSNALKEMLSSENTPEEISIEVKPSHSPSEENIKHRKFSYVTFWIKDKDGKSTIDKYVLFEPSKNIATDIATRFGKKTYGENFEKVYVYPRNYVREARKLLAAGKIIKWTESSTATKKESTWVIYSSTGLIDSLQISEKKAKEYIQRRPEFSQDKMFFEQMDKVKALHLLDKQKEDGENQKTDSAHILPPPLNTQEKLQILSEFETFHKKRKSEFSEVEIAEHEIPIQFGSWLKNNHPDLVGQKDSIWEENQIPPVSKNPGLEKPQIPKNDYRLFFSRFSDFTKAEVGQTTGSNSLESFIKWLNENYPNITDQDKKGITTDYTDYIQRITEGSKKIDLLSKPNKIQPYSSIFNKLGKVIPDLEENLNKGLMYGKSSFGEKSALMDLNLDVLVAKDDKGLSIIALSHLYKQAGDSIADPDMQIRIDFTMETAEALTFQDSFGFKQVYHQKGGKKLVDPRQKKEQNKFLSSWLTNLINTKHKIVWVELDALKSTQKEKVSGSKYRITQGWTNLDQKIITAFQKLIDEHPDKLIIEKEELGDFNEEENQKISIASITSDKDRISFQVYKDNTMLIHSLSPFLEGITYDSITIPKAKIIQTIQHMIKHPELLGEQPAIKTKQIIKGLNAALWQKEDNEYPVDKFIINHIAYHQSRLRELLLDTLSTQPPEAQMGIVIELPSIFQERIPFSGVFKKEKPLTKSESTKLKEAIRTYVDDIIIDNDLWIKKGTTKGVMKWLINHLFGSTDKLVDKPIKSNKMAKTTPKTNSFELNVMIEDFIVEKDHEDHIYSQEDKNYISQYTGGGGLIKQGAKGKGILYEYFTPDAIVQKMWGLAFKYGYTDGDVLEPACGIGNFIKYAPSTVKVVGYEINPYSNRIAEILYPHATIYQQPFETLFYAGNIHLKGDYSGDKFDLVIGNPPYGEFSGKWAGMGEKKWTGASEYDQYFITRGLDLLKENGLLIFIVPSSFLSNGSKYNKLKEKIASKADLIDAYRMPQGVFKTTSIGTDIVVFKKIQASV